MLFGSHMLMGYFVMLLVMTFEASMLIAVVIGLSTGFFIFELYSAREKIREGGDVGTGPSLLSGEVEEGRVIKQNGKRTSS